MKVLNVLWDVLLLQSTSMLKMLKHLFISGCLGKPFRWANFGIFTIYGTSRKLQAFLNWHLQLHFQHSKVWSPQKWKGKSLCKNERKQAKTSNSPERRSTYLYIYNLIYSKQHYGQIWLTLMTHFDSEHQPHHVKSHDLW